MTTTSWKPDIAAALGAHLALVAFIWMFGPLEFFRATDKGLTGENEKSQANSADQEPIAATAAELAALQAKLAQQQLGPSSNGDDAPATPPSVQQPAEPLAATTPALLATMPAATTRPTPVTGGETLPADRAAAASAKRDYRAEAGLQPGTLVAPYAAIVPEASFTVDDAGVPAVGSGVSLVAPVNETTTTEASGGAESTGIKALGQNDTSGERVPGLRVKNLTATVINALVGAGHALLLVEQLDRKLVVRGAIENPSFRSLAEADLRRMSKRGLYLADMTLTAGIMERLHDGAGAVKQARVLLVFDPWLDDLVYERQRQRAEHMGRPLAELVDTEGRFLIDQRRKRVDFEITDATAR